MEKQTGSKVRQGCILSPCFLTYMQSVQCQLHLSHVQLFCDPMDYSPPGSSVHGVLKARILEWVAISFSRGSTRPRDQTQVSCTAGRFFTRSEPPREYLCCQITLWTISVLVTGNTVESLVYFNLNRLKNQFQESQKQFKNSSLIFCFSRTTPDQNQSKTNLTIQLCDSFFINANFEKYDFYHFPCSYDRPYQLLLFFSIPFLFKKKPLKQFYIPNELFLIFLFSKNKKSNVYFKY